MARKGIGAAIVALVVWMSLAAGAAAGSWATVELEKPVTQVEVDTPSITRPAPSPATSARARRSISSMLIVNIRQTGMVRSARPG